MKCSVITATNCRHFERHRYEQSKLVSARGSDLCHYVKRFSFSAFTFLMTFNEHFYLFTQDFVAKSKISILPSIQAAAR